MKRRIKARQTVAIVVGGTVLVPGTYRVTKLGKQLYQELNSEVKLIFLNHAGKALRALRDMIPELAENLETANGLKAPKYDPKYQPAPYYISAPR